MPIVSTVMAQAPEVPFIVERADDVSHIVQVVDSTKTLIPVTGYTCTFKVYDNSEFTGSPLLTLDSASGGITVNGPAGQFTIIMTEVQTAGFTWQSGWYRMDMTSSGGTTTRIMQGPISVL